MEINIIGAGNWGTALSLCLSGESTHKNTHSISLFAKDDEQLSYVTKYRHSPKLKGFVINEDINLNSCAQLSEQQVENIEDSIAILCIPTAAICEFVKSNIEWLLQQKIIVVATKGLISDSLLLPHQYIHAEINKYNLSKELKVVVISGPSFAMELANCLPTALTIAHSSLDVAKTVAQILHRPHFRLYPSSDPNTTALGGAFKNILAVAAGMSDGLKLGDNARAALITRGIHEIGRYVKFFGGNRQSLYGLAGIGDILLSCTSNQSRNYQAGQLLATGKSKDLIINKIGTVEGINTTLVARQIIEEHGIYSPIIKTLSDVLLNNLSATQAIRTIIDNPPKTDETI